MSHPPGSLPASGSGADETPSPAVLLDSGLLAWQEGDRLGAASAWHQALLGAEERGDRRCLGAAHFNLAVLLSERGDGAGAADGFAAAYAAWSEGVDRRWLAEALAAGGDRLRIAGEIGAAGRHLEGALEMRRELGDHAEIALLLDRLGEIAAAQRRPEAARERWSEASGIHRSLDDGAAQVRTLERLARLELTLNRDAEADVWAMAAIDVPASEADLRPAVALLTDLSARALKRREWERARLCASAALGRPLEDDGARAELATLLATVAWAQREPSLALRWGREALVLLRQRNDPAVGALLHDLGVLAGAAGDADAAQGYFDEAMVTDRGGPAGAGAIDPDPSSAS